MISAGRRRHYKECCTPSVYVCLPFNSMTNVFLFVAKIAVVKSWKIAEVAGLLLRKKRPPPPPPPPQPIIKISLVSGMLPQYQWWWWLLPVLVPHVVLETTGLEKGLMDPHGGFGTRKPDQDQDPLGGLLDLPKPSTETSPGIPLRCGNQWI